MKVSFEICKTTKAEEHIYEIHLPDGKVLFRLARSSPTKHKGEKLMVVTAVYKADLMIDSGINKNLCVYTIHNMAETERQI